MIGFTGRFVGEVILLAAIGGVASYSFTQDELAAWLWETWKFVKQIFPLLILGVFLAGVFKAIIPGTWIQNLTGQNTIWANLIRPYRYRASWLPETYSVARKRSLTSAW